MTQLVVSALIMNSQGKFLMGRYKYSGKYQTPGGKVERGEKLIDAVLRELFEETSVIGDRETIEYFGYAEPTGLLVHNFWIPDWSGHIVNVEPKKNLGWEWLDTIPGSWEVVEGVNLARVKYIQQIAKVRDANNRTNGLLRSSSLE